jgi:hypothetical protein
MCKAFSCLVTIDRKVTWKMGMDSHTDLVQMAEYKDQTADPHAMEFARIEITPDNNNYLYPDAWTLKVDERIKPSWLVGEHEEVCLSAHKQWMKQLDKLIVRKAIVHPFKIKPPAKIAKQHIALLKQWDSVRDSVRDSVGDSVRDSVGASVWASVGDSVRDSVRDSVWDSVGASVWASVRDSVRDSVWASVRDSVGAYTGSFFVINQWKYIKHPAGEYPFAPCVKLWEKGLVPSFDGKTWRLHGGEKAAILFEISAEELRK